MWALTPAQYRVLLLSLPKPLGVRGTPALSEDYHASAPDTADEYET